MGSWTPEAVMATATSLVLLAPTIVVWLSYARVRSQRLLFAALAFTVFLLNELAVLAIQVGWPSDTSKTEIIEFVGDIATASLFAAAFLWPTARASGE